MEGRACTFPKDVVAACTRLPVVRDLFLTDIGNYRRAEGHFVDRKRPLSETVLIYCLSGTGWFRLRDRKQNVSEGMALFLPAGESHAYGADAGAPWSICWLHFAGSRMSEYLEALRLEKERPLLYVPDSVLVTHAFEEMYRYIGEGYTENALLALSTELGRFLGLLKMHQKAPLQKGRRAQQGILDSIRFMRRNLEKNLSLQQLARVACMSLAHYGHLFRDQTGASPRAFFIRLKMQRACEQLHTTEQSVSEIGAQAGFEDPFHFSRVFKKSIGLSPSAYRKISRSHSDGRRG